MNPSKSMNNSFNPPFFSVIIPTYNRCSLLIEAINSVLNQSFLDFELLIIDDGSTDETKDAIEKKFFQKTSIHYFYQNRKGVGTARNYGIRESKGKWIAFLDSDDLWLPHHLESHYNLIQSFQDRVNWIHSRSNFIGLTGEAIESSSRLLEGDVFLSLVREGNGLNMNTITLRSEILKKYYFNENPDLKVSEDWELWVRIAATYKLHYCPEITCLTRLHPKRSMYNLEKVKIGAWAAVDSLVNNNEIASRLDPYKKQMLGYICFYLATNYYGAGLMSEARRHLQRAIFHDIKLVFSLKINILFFKTLIGFKKASMLKDFLAFKA